MAVKRVRLHKWELDLLIVHPVSRLSLSATFVAVGCLVGAAAVYAATTGNWGSAALVGILAVASLAVGLSIFGFSVVAFRFSGVASLRSGGWVPLESVNGVRVERMPALPFVVLDTDEGVRRVWTAGASLFSGRSSADVVARAVAAEIDRRRERELEE